MKTAGRSAAAVSCAVLCGLVLAGCGNDGLKGTIQNYDDVSVWSGPGMGQRVVGELTTLAPVTVKCYADHSFKISYDGGSGWIDADTSILSKKGEVAPGMVPKC
ncbi:hypothetical protein ACF061_17510 [Streptomyces sp. NPDC015220]|uniref:hypothetical protein n=1 Tax=Streptomyces sp. NPDC015220 TaxID=3364947 RepID=UPI0036F9CC5D